MKGEDVLRALIARVDRNGSPGRGLEAAASAAALASDLKDAGKLWARADGRIVAATMNRLEEKRLVAAGRRARALKSGRIKTYSTRVYSPTQRGRDVIAILDRVKVDGHPAAGLLSLGLEHGELYVLR